MNVANLHKHPLVQGVKGIFASYPDVLENIECFYSDDGDDVPRGYSCNNDSELQMTDDLIRWINRRRQNIKNAQWLDPDTIGSNKETISSDMFNENETALIICFPNYYNKYLYDLIILYPKFTESSLFTSSKKFSIQDKKAIIFCVMEKATKERLSREYDVHTSMEKNKKQFKRMESNTQSILKKQLNYVKDIVNEHYAKGKIQVALLEDAEQFIINAEMETQYLIDVLKESVEIVRNIQNISTGKIELNGFLIGLAMKSLEDNRFASSDKSAPSKTSVGQFSIVTNYLDHLEEAIDTIYKSKNKDQATIRLNDIAKNMPTSGTASAIIDRIKKYQKNGRRITTLMDDKNNAARWQLLRKCPPIQKLINKEYC